MSSRPRLGGEGRLRMPDQVSVGRDGQIWGVLGDRSVDPFERTGEDLLLVEAFARLELRRPRKARDWFAEHGVPDLASLFPELFDGGDFSLGTDGFGDAVTDALEQQVNVRWHLAALARLSLERERAGAPRPGAVPHEGWDPAWAQAALRGPDSSVLWLGARTGGEARIALEMQRYARYEDVPRRAPLSEYNLGGMTPKAFTERWWPAAHAAWERIRRAAIPVLWVPDDELYEQWRPAAGLGEPLPGSDWHGLLELERRLLEPYVRQAAARDLHIARVPPPQPPAPGESGGERWYGNLVVHEERSWRSLLAPVYLQLFEALRRISEGRPGAAFCRECGQPFLILDARRSAFCNDRERSRWFQRERRKRLATPPAPAGMSR